MAQRTLNIIDTQDGSHTIFIPELQEQYHSVYGAIQESRHIYIDAGFCSIVKPEIFVFEMGFGTGLNAFLTLVEAMESKQKVFYHSVEKYPLPESIFLQLNYGTIIKNGAYSTLFEALHRVSWNQQVCINEYFTIEKTQCDLLEYDLPYDYDVVYYDAFAPKIQPHLWEHAVFEKIAARMKDQGIFTTYSSKNSVAQSLKKLGLSVKKLPGPPGKREFIRAVKNVNI